MNVASVFKINFRFLQCLEMQSIGRSLVHQHSAADPLLQAQIKLLRGQFLLLKIFYSLPRIIRVTAGYLHESPDRSLEPKGITPGKSLFTLGQSTEWE